MPRLSAGVVLYRRAPRGFELFLVHPGGPLWKNKDAGAWSFPKGEHSANEDASAVARREFQEETGFPLDGDLTALTPITQRGGKVVRLFAIEGDCDASAIQSNMFTMEWPPQSGRTANFPEVDRAGWFLPGEAREKLNPAQAAAIDELLTRLSGGD
jgi:predicted NUDIX family NTP pyrophosphohydrolase